MYVCAKCNIVVDRPQKRWWSRWHYCPSGHVLYVAGLGASVEQSFSRAFRGGLERGLVMLLLVLLLALGPDYQAKRGAAGVGGLVAILYLFTGLWLLLKAHGWARRSGPIQRLIPGARGRAWGFLTALLCQLAFLALLISQLSRK